MLNCIFIHNCIWQGNNWKLMAISRVKSSISEVTGQIENNQKARDQSCNYTEGLNRTDERLGLIWEGVSVNSKLGDHFVKHQKSRDLSSKYLKLHHWRGSKLLFDGDDEHGHDKGVEHENNRGLESTRVDEHSQYGEDLGWCFTVAWRLDCS